MTFAEFTHSTDTAYNLAMLFLSSYERPANQDQPNRGTQAANWFTILSGGSNPTPPPISMKNDYIKLLLCDSLNGWKW
jgi:hypothetical protein